MGVADGCGLHGGRRQRLGFQAVPEDGVDALVAEGVQRQGAGAGGFQALRAGARPQAQDAQAGPVALDGVGAGDEDLLHQAGGGGADLLRPADQALGTPLHILPVMAGHVGQHRGVPAPLGGAQV